MAAHHQTTPDQHFRWDDCIMPNGFGMDARGVFFKPEDPDKPEVEVTSSPLVMAYLIRTSESDGWSCCLQWLTLDKRVAQKSFPLKDIIKRGSPLVDELAGKGLIVRHEGLLRQYLVDIANHPDLPRRRGVTQLSFSTATSTSRPGKEVACFVLPDQTLYHDPGDILEPVQLLPDAESPVHAAYRASGTLEEWQAMIETTRGNHLLTFVLAVSFAAALLDYSDVESGGFNLSGQTSRGKTTALQVSASVWGSGAATNQASRTGTLINTWLTTDNGLEALAQAHAGMPLLIDEIGTHTSGPLPIYSLFAGQGKTRMSGRISMGRRGRPCSCRRARSTWINTSSASAPANRAPIPASATVC